MPPSFQGLAPTELSRCDSSSSFLQSGFWGSFKARFGWNARAFLIDWGEGGKLPLLVIRRRLMPFASFAYVPWGPELPKGGSFSDTERTALLESIAVALAPQLPPDTAFIRFDPPWYTEGADVGAPVISEPFSRAGADVQPPDTVLVDLTSDEEAILAAMKPKWRYNIRLADKKGVAVRRMDLDGLDSFYNLYLETSRRDKIAIHGKEYYRALLTQKDDYGACSVDVRLYVAEFENTPIASIITLFKGEVGTYLYGASSDAKRHLMPAYALQWRSMQDAKKEGCLRYDLFGIPPNDDPSHPMAGLYRFKTGFGGSIVHRSGSWDYPYKVLTTKLFKMAESFRKGLRSAKKARRKRSDGNNEKQ